MAINTEEAIEALALSVLGDLAQQDEYLPLGAPNIRRCLMERARQTRTQGASGTA
jgi:hypothetical protein